MDHKETVEQLINGVEVSVPMDEMSKFYRTLIQTLDSMGNAVVTKPSNPLGLAYGLQKVAREYVLSRTNHREAEQALKVALRIFAHLAPDDLQTQAESCRLASILLAAQGRYQEAQLCDEKAVSLAMTAEATDGSGSISQQ